MDRSAQQSVASAGASAPDSGSIKSVPINNKRSHSPASAIAVDIGCISEKVNSL